VQLGSVSVDDCQRRLLRIGIRYEQITSRRDRSNSWLFYNNELSLVVLIQARCLFANSNRSDIITFGYYHSPTLRSFTDQ